MKKNLKIFKINRFNHKNKKSYIQSYEVPFEFGQTVLDGLIYIQDFLDPSLSLRYSCREGVCGSCGMHINGKYRLACQTQLKDIKSKTVRIRPLGNLPVLKDLIVDLTSFWDKYRYVNPYLMPYTPAPEKERIQATFERDRLGNRPDCILCALCYSACPITGLDPQFLGPAALTKASRFIEDSRDKAYDERLKLVDGPHGVWRCHTAYNCQEVCPKDVDPTSAISVLKRQIIGLRVSYWELYKKK